MAAGHELELVFVFKLCKIHWQGVGCQQPLTAGEIPVSRYWKQCLSLVGFFFRATRSGGQLPITFSRSRHLIIKRVKASAAD
jgi:hypothetical protein